MDTQTFLTSQPFLALPASLQKTIRALVAQAGDGDAATLIDSLEGLTARLAATQEEEGHFALALEQVVDEWEHRMNRVERAESEQADHTQEERKISDLLSTVERLPDPDRP